MQCGRYAKVNYQPQGREGKLATVKDSKTDVSGFSPSSELIASNRFTPTKG